MAVRMAATSPYCDGSSRCPEPQCPKPESRASASYPWSVVFQSARVRPQPCSATTLAGLRRTVREARPPTTSSHNRETA